MQKQVDERLWVTNDCRTNSTSDTRIALSHKGAGVRQSGGRGGLHRRVTSDQSIARWTATYCQAMFYNVTGQKDCGAVR